MKTLPLILGTVVTVAHGADGFERALSTDRPDATESPYTVEAGRWQAEIEPLRWSRDEQGGVRLDTFTAGAVNLKHGATPSADVQLILEPYIRRRLRVDGVRETNDGLGDTVVRLKVNMQGNDAEGYAWGLMPFVKLPTASGDLGNGDAEGGLIVPVAFPLSNGWDCGLMAEMDIVRNDADNGYRTAVTATATVAGDIAPGVGLFLELANEAASSDTSEWATSFNTGVTVALSENRQLDTGVNVGLSDAAEDIAVFLGFTSRW